MLSEKEKQALKQKIQANQHELYVVSIEEMEAIIKSSPQGSKPSVQAAWKEIKDKVGVGASYYASVDDAVTMAKLIGDLGGVGARAYIKTYGGKPHIVLKGRANLRNILTATKYGIKNPKVISMGLGKSGAIAAAKQGGIITVVLLSVYRVADYFLTDQATLSELIGTLATDVVKVGIATGASILMASAVGAATFAVGPIIAVVIVGVGVSMLLEHADSKLGITNRVIAGLDELSDSTELFVAQKRKHAIDMAGSAVGEIVDYAMDSARAVAVIWIRQTMREYLTPFPK